MRFNSTDFLIFFPVVTILYYWLPHRVRWLLLLVSSCFFYMMLMPVYILILGAIILTDYTTAFFIDRHQGQRRKLYLCISLTLNLGVLFFFKYYNFFASESDALLGYLRIPHHPLPFLHLLLPLGLSFHTFQAMSYTIEVYRGRAKPERHLGLYALYVMFYPQLVAGPIERPQNILPQFRQPIPLRYENLISGLRLMLWGLFKKVVIADRISGYANVIFDDPTRFHNLQILVGVLAFTIQIYADFSGYTDVALGAARCMGFRLMINFSRPYFATDIRAFWGRWHISLSTWFRDYVYIPLGGSRGSTGRVYINILIVFLLSGFWHGANRTFVAWGAIHAFFYFVFIAWQKLLPSEPGKWRIGLGWFLTFGAVAIAWIFFRADSMDKAYLMLSRIVAWDSSFYTFTPLEFFKTFSIVISLLLCAYMFFIEHISDPMLSWFDDRVGADTIFCSATLLLILCFGVFQEQPFIYFQF
ncbi:MAG: MBOAT family protein [Bacteroidetes bacterium]|nr:MBOAT family protein [Bacteroidota bacterium]